MLDAKETQLCAEIKKRTSTSLKAQETALQDLIRINAALDRNYEVLFKALELVPTKIISCEESLMSAFLHCNERLLRLAKTDA